MYNILNKDQNIFSFFRSQKVLIEVFKRSKMRFFSVFQVSGKQYYLHKLLVHFIFISMFLHFPSLFAPYDISKCNLELRGVCGKLYFLTGIVIQNCTNISECHLVRQDYQSSVACYKHGETFFSTSASGDVNTGIYSGLIYWGQNMSW